MPQGVYQAAHWLRQALYRAFLVSSTSGRQFLLGASAAAAALDAYRCHQKHMLLPQPCRCRLNVSPWPQVRPPLLLSFQQPPLFAFSSSALAASLSLSLHTIFLASAGTTRRSKCWREARKQKWAGDDSSGAREWPDPHVHCNGLGCITTDTHMPFI